MKFFLNKRNIATNKKCNLNTQKMNIERNKYMDKYISTYA